MHAHGSHAGSAKGTTRTLRTAPRKQSQGAHLVGHIEHAILDLAVDLPGGVDERLHSSTTGGQISAEQSDRRLAGGRTKRDHGRMPQGLRDHADDRSQPDAAPLTSSTLWAVRADVSRNIKPCSLANCSPSSVVTARRCCEGAMRESRRAGSAAGAGWVLARARALKARVRFAIG